MTDIVERLRDEFKEPSYTARFNLADAASEIETLRKQRDELLEDLQIIASVAHCGGLGELNVDDVVMAIRHRTTAYFRKDASDDTHREAIATVTGARNENRTRN
jgi:hypothetical protein